MKKTALLIIALAFRAHLARAESPVPNDRQPAKSERRTLRPISFSVAGSWAPTTTRSFVQLVSDPRAKTTITIGGTNTRTVTISTADAAPENGERRAVTEEKETVETTSTSQVRANLGNSVTLGIDRAASRTVGFGQQRRLRQRPANQKTD